jgi:hypothetical protein
VDDEEIGLDTVRGDAGWGVVEYYGDPRSSNGRQPDAVRLPTDVRREI